MAGQSASVLREIVYRKRHNVETKWPDLSRARSEIHREWLLLAHLLKEKQPLVCWEEMKAVFLSPGEKGESLFVYRCLSFSQNTDDIYFQFASQLRAPAYREVQRHLLSGQKQQDVGLLLCHA